jgi:hypothetical protein
MCKLVLTLLACSAARMAFAQSIPDPNLLAAINQISGMQQMLMLSL